MIDHTCTFPEVEIEEGDEDENLKVGMKVLTPCLVCGDTPLDHLAFMEARQQELQAALLTHEPNQPMYHWSPAARRKQINRFGLLPGKRPVTTTTGDRKIPYVCFADSPSWAWALSGDMRHCPAGEWDLWQTWLDRIIDPVVHATPDRPSGLYEVRTEHRIYKRDLWYVGSRVKK